MLALNTLLPRVVNVPNERSCISRGTAKIAGVSGGGGGGGEGSVYMNSS